MTSRQMVYYRAIQSFCEKHRRSPTFAEIAQLVGVTSQATVHRIVHKMIDLGILKQTPGMKYANLEIVPQKMHSMNSCNRGHGPIWFMCVNCPLCDTLETLRRIRGENTLTATQGGK